MTVDVQEIKDLVEELSNKVDEILKMSNQSELRREYQKWYSQVQLIVNKYLPSMSNELNNLYYTPSHEKDASADAWHYCGIRSFLRTTKDWPKKVDEFRRRFDADIEQQRGILLSVPDVLDFHSIEVATLVTADLVEGELNEARLLLDHGFIRAAGAVAGVALESHLKLLHDQSGIQYTDKDSIVPLATKLRMKGVISLGDEKQCIAMADTRNKCDHKKKRDPTPEEVEELITDVDRFTKRIQVI